MNIHEKIFNWVNFEEGVARFVGNIRGWDELGHDAFAVEINERQYYGEMRQVFSENQNDYNIEIISFGWPGEEWVGMPMPGMCAVLTVDDVKTAQALIVQLVQIGSKFVDTPSVLYQTSNSHFMGMVIFREGWALISGYNSEELAP